MKKFIALTITLVLFLTVFATAKILAPEEIPALSESSAEAAGLHKLGILLGTGNGFELERSVTRAEAVVLLFRMHPEITGSVGMPSPEFDDMDGHWAYKEVTAAKKMGLVDGTTDKTFTPDRTVSGREFAKMTLSLLGYKNITIENAYELGEEHDLLANNFTRSVVFDDRKLTRGDTVRICWSALAAKTADDKLLYRKLIEAGKYEENDFYGVLFTSDPAALSGTFAENINAQMPEDKNYMFSPLSIKLAFAMAANGASGETKSQIENALGIEDLDTFNENTKTLIEKYNNAEILKLNVANSIWINSSRTPQRFSKDYSDKLNFFFSADSFVADGENIVKDINGWVNDKTNGKIDKIINSDDFWSMLVNAVYFKGAWQNEFSESATKPDIFTDRNGNEKTTDFMNRTGYYRYLNDGVNEIICLPYKNGYFDEEKGDNIFYDLDVAMYLVKGNFSEHALNDFTENSSTDYISLSMPKFKFEYSTSLKNTMQNLGIDFAFHAEKADFSGMFDSGNMFITDALHKTYINVNEKGTEAAAVTAIMMAGSSLPPEPIEVKYNEPFTFVIRDNDSGEILFLGRYAFVEEN